jgi:hypothetical protein
MSKDPALVLRVALSAVAVAAAVAHTLFRPFIPDAITAGLIILAPLPWLSSIIKSIEVAGVGKLELQVEEVKEKAGSAAASGRSGQLAVSSLVYHKCLY